MAAALEANRIGGIESFARELAVQLGRKGWDLIVCYENEAQGIVREFLLEPGNVSLEVMPRQIGLGAENSRAFLRLMRRHRPQAVMYWLGGVVRWWPLIARAMGARRVVFYDGTSRTSAAMHYRAKPHVRLAMRPLTEAICATRFIKDCSDREGIVPPHKSRVVYSGIDNDRSYGDGAAFRARYGIDPGKTVVLQVSWLVPVKGIDVALRAAKLALAGRQDLHFVFCGEGVNRQEYEALAQELGIAEHVTWTGQLRDLAGSGAFRAAEMQIQCSQWQEAFCLAVAEGMSAGLPVVASRTGGLPELVTEGENGLLFEPRDESTLAAHILRLAADKELRERMGRAGRERALAQLDLTGNVAQWVEALTR
jgi:glycosyltransferase involved in cell wall biosynthesis